MRKIRLTKIFILLLLLGFCASCSKQIKDNNSNIFTIPVNIKEDVLVLSKIADSIRYIPLSNDILLRDINTLKVDKQGAFYITDSKGDGIFKFDKSGNFIRQISSRGQGPEEYINISDIDLYQDQISFCNGANSILYFDLEGNFLKRKKLPDNWIFTVSSGDTIYGSNCRTLTTIIGEKEEVYSFDTPEETLLSMHSTHFTRNGSQIYWEDLFNDTIYNINKGIPSPFVYIDFGEMKLPEDIIRNNEIYSNNEITHYCTDINGFRISDYYMFFSFSLAKHSYSCLYNRKNHSVYTFLYINNDIDNMPLGAWIIAISSKKLYSCIPMDLLAAYYSGIKNSKKEEDRKIADNIEKLLGKVPDEMDNPVLVEITCK